jgi:hypothetical protein
VSIVENVRAKVAPNRAIEVGIVVVGATAVVVIYRADRRYRRWAEQRSPLTAPRARAAAFHTNYRRKRSSFSDAMQIIGDIFDVVEQVRVRAAEG